MMESWLNHPKLSSKAVGLYQLFQSDLFFIPKWSSQRNVSFPKRLMVHASWADALTILGVESQVRSNPTTGTDHTAGPDTCAKLFTNGSQKAQVLPLVSRRKILTKNVQGLNSFLIFHIFLKGPKKHKALLGLKSCSRMPTQPARPRMIDKLQKTIDGLESNHGDLNDAYSAGAVEGFDSMILAF